MDSPESGEFKDRGKVPSSHLGCQDSYGRGVPRHRPGRSPL